MANSKNKRRRMRASIEMLERRDVPATWGIPWADPGHLTVSFAPDGTNVQGQASRLTQDLNAQLGAGDWQGTILKALQTWASNANIDIGLVADGGQPIATAGPAQGDPRFGDIRVSAAPLSPGVLAISTPYDPSTGTLSGDIILNSNVDFNPSDAGSYDLYSAVLHEAGHVFGFADSTDPTSFMYNVYGGTVSGLGAGAAPALQALYGAPTPDPTEQPAGTSNLGKSANLTPNPNQPGAATADAGIVLAGDYGLFKYQASGGVSYSSGLDVAVQTAGISLLTPTVKVYDARGNLLAQSSASGPTDGGTSVHLGGVASNGTYYIAVSGSADAFGVGDYHLSVGPTNGATSTNLGGASKIDAPKGSSGPLTVGVVVSAQGQSDLYSFNAPASATGGMTVRLMEWGVGLALPTVTIYNASGALVSRATALDLADGVAFYVPSVTPGAQYYARVDGGLTTGLGAGLYRLGLDFSGNTTGTGNLAAMTYASDSGASNGKGHGNGNGGGSLTPVSQGDASSYAAVSSLTSSTPQLAYELKAPKSKGGDLVLTATVEGLDANGFAPALSVTDKKGNPVPYQVLAAEGGTMVLQVDQAGGNDYLIQVSGGQPGAAMTTGNFFLGVTLGSMPASFQSLASGTVGTSANDPGVSTTIALPTDQIFRFVLAANPGASGSAALMTITDANGNVVATLVTQAGSVNSLTAHLGAGTFTIKVTALPPQGGQASPLTFALTGSDLSDPLRGYISGGTGSSGTGLPR